MARTYHFKGSYIQINNQTKKVRHINNCLYILMQIIIFLLVLGTTEYIFTSVLCTKDFYEVISLCAVFATLGSSLISITSLTCNYYFGEYQKAKEILFASYSNQTIEDVWNFVSDVKVLLKNAKYTISYNTFSPEVIFEFGISNLSISIPTSKKELKLGQLIRNIVKMKITEELYFRNLEQNCTSLEEGGIFVWECTIYMLKNAFLYKFYLSFTILGGMFFVAGLIAVFIHS